MMGFVLLDTTFASLLHPRKSHTPAAEMLKQRLILDDAVVSFQTVAELWFWAEKRNWGTHAIEELTALIDRIIVIPADLELARVWAHVVSYTSALGRRLDTADAWIAATAVLHQLPLVTTDTDFHGWTMPGLHVELHHK